MRYNCAVMLQTKKALVVCICTMLLFIVWLPAGDVRAQAGSAYDLINAVNQLRATYGLAPYEIDPALMSVAQSHSEYQASIQTGTHLRADGTGPQHHGISSENIAWGTQPVSVIVNSTWQDYWHLHTMIGYSTGRVGAGAAVANGITYYTLDVVNTGTFTKLAEYAGSTPQVVAGSTTTPQSIQQVAVATPREDGAVIHEVAYGQTLWSISEAYGVPIETLSALNRELSSNLWVGQKIIIRPSLEATQTPTITMTILPPTRTLRPTRTPEPVIRLTSTPKPTATPTPKPLLPQLSLTVANPYALAMIILCTCGLVGMGISSLVEHRRRKQ